MTLFFTTVDLSHLPLPEAIEGAFRIVAEQANVPIPSPRPTRTWRTSTPTPLRRNPNDLWT